MAKRLAVVVSQGQSHNPAKRQLEEDIVTALLMEKGVDVTVIPHLYDLKPDGTGMLALKGISGSLVVLSWLFPRAARWILDRNDVRGQEGVSLLKSADETAAEEDEDDENVDDESNGEANGKTRVTDHREVPNRAVYCISLSSSDKAEEYVTELKRILAEQNTSVVSLTDWIAGTPSPEQAERFANPVNNTAIGPVSMTPKPRSAANGQESKSGTAAQANQIDDESARRWYPVIDFSRCTNCMECIDFCLFGVYGVDAAETILVEQPDNCRKGCPACSRVCPENAIIFPQHKSPAIAGAPVMSGGLKIDLSKLFGAPDSGKSAIEIAANERDEQLMLAGREAVGLEVGVPKRQERQSIEAKDELDNLIDELDELDL